MATFVTSLFASSAAPAAAGGGITAASYGGPAGGTGGTAAAAGATGGGISASQVLSGAVTGFTALSEIAGGFRRSSDLKRRADEEEALARGELIRGKREANDLTDELLERIATSQVVFAANGIDVSGGSASSALSLDQAQGERQAADVREDAKIRSLARRASRRNLLFAADQAKVGGFLQAGGTLLGAGQRALERG